MLNENIIDSLIDYICSIEPIEDKQEELYNKYELYIIKKAEEIRSKLNYRNGVYYPIDELFNGIEYIKELRYYIMDQLKCLGVEYFKNELYRIVY